MSGGLKNEETKMTNSCVKDTASFFIYGQRWTMILRNIKEDELLWHLNYRITAV